MGESKTALGLMSGTSMDGIDLAILTTDGEIVQALGPSATLPYDPALRRRLGAVVAAGGAGDDLPALEADLTDAYGRAIERFLSDNGVSPTDIDLVGCHGQTILHRPERRYTRQLGDGAQLAARLDLPVVNDFRLADVAAGGQGAPFAPLYHVALARDLEGPLAVLNLGGVGNVTFIDGDAALAFDTGPGNAMIDDWVARTCGVPYDDGGRIAADGRADAAALGRLVDHPYFAVRPPKSLDRNDFSLDPVMALTPADGAATLAAFTVQSVAQSVEHLPARPTRWLVTGGGRHNPTIMSLLRDALGVPVDPVEAVGWNGDALEAQAFAFLAVRSLRGLPLSLPTTTGVPQPMPGGRLHAPAGRAA